GYEIGYNLPRTDAQNAADKDAAQAARIYVENVLRPSYFEEAVQAEIKKPFFVQKRLEVPLFFQFELARINTNLEITDEELVASDRLVTSYDEVINQFKKEKIAQDQSYEHLSNAVNSYEEQESYPYDRVDCSQVYKGVMDFKLACEEEFHRSYRSHFEESAYESYKNSFLTYFSEAFEATFNEVTKKQYEVAYDKAYEVTKQFGKEEGRRVMYDEAYELQYKISYEKHLEMEKKRVQGEVVGELVNFLEAYPLLTMAELKGPEEIIAGDTFKISSLIRNLGKNKAGIGHLKIVKISGAEIVTNKVTTPEIMARSQSEVLGPEVRVKEDLVTGKKVVVEVEATLPGDNYKSSRIEKLVFERTVSVSPIQELNLNVDNSPSIRNILRRFLIHSLSVEVSPKFEDLKSDLDVNLVALRGSEHVEFKVSSQQVARMKKGDKRNIKFSYVFKDSAKGQDIVMALQFLYKGRVVQTEQIILKPH
ncbi:MAG TPA: hypothetical protein VKZ84_07710, partial [Bacteriovoracaceae bacterium]|nr:hypothetical protein [Bacteriovoracaceae bacterium]